MAARVGACLAMAMMSLVTDFGNPGVLLALGALVAAWLGWVSGLRDSVAWISAIATVGLVTGCFKTYLSACRLKPLSLHSPSGHVAASAVVYGGIALILAVGQPRWRRLLIVTTGTAWIALIGASRISIGAHNPVEVIAGGLIGAAILSGYARFYLKHPVPRAYLRPLLLALFVAALALRELPVHFEPLFIDYGRLLHAQLPWMCQPQ